MTVDDSRQVKKSEETEVEEPDTNTVSERTKIPLGTLIALFSVIIVLITVTWYLGTMLSKIEVKLDTMAAMMTTVSTKNATIEVKQSDHEREDLKMWTMIDGRLSVIEKSGSEKTRDIEKELNALRNDFRVHEMMSKNGVKP